MAASSESTTSLSPSGQPNLAALTKKLLVTWGCGLLFGGGLFLTILFVAGLVGAAVGSFGAFSAEPWICVVAGLGMGIMYPGPMLLGSHLAGSWRRGVTSGLLALLVGVIVFVIDWTILGGIPHSWRQSFLFSATSGLHPGIGAAAVVLSVLLMNTDAFPRYGLGLGMGLAIGLGLSVVAGTSTLDFLWEIPPLVWVSAVYFPELMAGRSGWKGFVVWALFILTTFGLPFIVVPLLGRLFG